MQERERLAYILFLLTKTCVFYKHNFLLRNHTTKAKDECKETFLQHPIIRFLSFPAIRRHLHHDNPEHAPRHPPARGEVLEWPRREGSIGTVRSEGPATSEWPLTVTVSFPVHTATCRYGWVGGRVGGTVTLLQAPLLPHARPLRTDMAKAIS